LKISIDHKFDTKLVEQWIEFNLNSRYAIQVKQGIDSNRKLVSITEIGMEDPKELTMLSLGCHHLHKQKEF
jgi:macrodomain Ter protein organizer (MatP/YcbG family)